MSKNLNENQLFAIPLVAQGVSGKDIAKTLKITEETVSRWKQQPEFKAEVNQLLKQFTEMQKMMKKFGKMRLPKLGVGSFFGQ